MKVRNLLKPVYWRDTGDCAYRIVSKNGIASPVWVQPISYASVIAHDIFDHVSWRSPYTISDEIDPYINEIWSAGVFTSHCSYNRYINVFWAIKELEDFLENAGLETLDTLAENFPRCKDSMYFQKVMFHSNNQWMERNRVDDTDTLRRLVQIAYRGYCYGKKYPQIGKMRQHFIDNWKDYFPGMNTLILERECYPEYYGVSISVDFSTGQINSRQVKLKEQDWEIYEE